jgi:antitoxin component YwqK of YwqJK toxin-antitoxin module
MRYILQILFLKIMIINGALAQADTVYFDADWKTIEKGKHSYYRVGRQQLDVYTIEDYFSNGQLQSKGSCKDAALKIEHGYFIIYDMVGNKKEEGAMVDGNRVGVWKAYRRLCDTTYQDEYSNYIDGKQNGEELIIHSSTRKFIARINYLNNELFGECTVYDLNGKLREIKNYKNNMLNGYFKAFSSRTGHVLAEGNMYQDTKVGTWYYFWDSDLPSDSSAIDIFLDSSAKDVSAVAFDSASHKRIRYGMAVYNRLHGEWVEYFEDTDLVDSRITYNMDKKEGPFKKYNFTTGRVRSEGSYKNDEKHGKIVEYDEEGNLEEESYFN